MLACVNLRAPGQHREQEERKQRDSQRNLALLEEEHLIGRNGLVYVANTLVRAQMAQQNWAEAAATRTADIC